jgi:hypothetical protein
MEFIDEWMNGRVVNVNVYYMGQFGAIITNLRRADKNEVLVWTRKHSEGELGDLQKV